MSFMSGEPVPPGFEDEMSRTAIIQKQIDGFKGGALIGTEYVVELHEDGQVRPDYFCVLCNTCNDSRSIFIHWTSVTHRTNYLKTHFQKAFELMQQFRRTTNNSNELMLNATTKLVVQIEKHFGRSGQILAVAGEDFRRFRAKICSQVRDKFHFDECAGPDFIDEVRQNIKELKPADILKNVTLNTNNERHVESSTAQIALDAISSDDDDVPNFAPSLGQLKQQPSQLQKQHLKKSRKKHHEEQQPAYRAVNRSPPMDKGGDPKLLATSGVKQTLPTPKELSMQASHIAQERYKWEKFRCLLELQLKQLRDETETYETNPEKHPDYSEEWKQFWNRRYKELQEEKKCDPNSYDYKPEWITYWKERRVELFNIAVSKIKKELKDKFKLGDEDEENTKELMERYKIRIAASPKDAAANPTNPAAAAAAVRRKPNYRGQNNRGAAGNDAIIDISDDEHEQQSPSGPNSRPRRRPPYARSESGSISPKRARPAPTRRRSRTRSPLPARRRGGRSRSRSRSQHRRSSRSPYSRNRHNEDYGERDRERERERERERDRDRARERGGVGDFYRERDRGDSYSRSSTRNYEHVETFRVLDSRNYPEYSQRGMRSITPSAGKETEQPDDNDGPLTVVSVLRMLAALEDHLGSLGPKALHLLSKALAMEKIKPNAADDLLLNEDNCVFMETTKEKLKGILIAEVLDDPQKVRVVKKLISNIASIIFQVTSKGTSMLGEAFHGDPKKKEYQLPFDRQIASSKLASMLVKNGLDDLCTDDMNRLLHFFTLMVKTNQTRRLNFMEVSLRLGLPNAAAAAGGSGAGVCGVSAGKGKLVPDLDIDIGELMREVELQLAKDAATKEAAKAAAASAAAAAAITEATAAKAAMASDSNNGMESLTDSDLQTLLQNFKFLSNEEQVHLIGHLRKLEVLEPPRVERLRKYVNIAELSSDGESCSDYLSRVAANVRPGLGSGSNSGSSQPSTSRMCNAAGGVGNNAARRKSLERDCSGSTAKLQRRGGNIGGGSMSTASNFMLDDDDDDDYNFDDLVMKANDSNKNLMGNAAGIVPVESSPNALTFKPAAPKISLKDTENIIASLMGTLTSQSNLATKQQQQQRAGVGGSVANQMQQQRTQQQYGLNNGGAGGASSGNYYNFATDQMSSGNSGGNSAYVGAQQQQQSQSQQQQQQPPYSMGNYNAYGGPMGYGGQMNPWASAPGPYNNNNYMQPQQQQQQQAQYNNNSNMFGGHQ